VCILKITEDDLKCASSKNIISEQQSAALWQFLNQRTAEQPSFSLIHILYYLGALIVISAMGWFMDSSWDAFGGAGIFAIASAYAFLFIACGIKLNQHNHLKIPAGLFITMAVCMTPLAIYGLQRWLNIWAYDDPGEYRSFYLWTKGGWFTMEIATIATGLLALRFLKFTFLIIPIALSLWFFSMDLTSIVFQADGSNPLARQWVSIAFGLCMIAASYIIDLRSKTDFSFWGYIFGATIFWVALFLMDDANEVSRFVFFLTNISLIALSVFLHRKIFLVFGGIGVFVYFEHLASSFFENTIFFPFALSALGLALLYIAIVLNKHGAKVEAAFISILPQWLQNLRPHKKGLKG